MMLSYRCDSKPEYSVMKMILDFSVLDGSIGSDFRPTYLTHYH